MGRSSTSDSCATGSPRKASWPWPQVTSEKVGAVGFCMGGQLARYAGAEFPDRIGAVVDFYGIHPNVRIEPARIRVPVLAHFAERDKSVKIADARALAAGIEAAGGSIEAHFYSADHAFFNDSRPTVPIAPRQFRTTSPPV